MDTPKEYCDCTPRCFKCTETAEFFNEKYLKATNIVTVRAIHKINKGQFCQCVIRNNIITGNPPTDRQTETKSLTLESPKVFLPSNTRAVSSYELSILPFFYYTDALPSWLRNKFTNFKNLKNHTWDLPTHKKSSYCNMYR